MTNGTDVFSQINNAVLDLQAADYQSYARPLKALGRLLQSSDLAAANEKLTEGLDLEAFLTESLATQGSMVGSAELAWPEDHDAELGLTFLLIQKFSQDPGELMQFGHTFFNAGSKLSANLHAVTRQLIIPFVRDYKTYVLNQGTVQPKLVMTTLQKVFIVHGHDDAARYAVARFLDRIGLVAIVLAEQADKGQTIIEKFEASAAEVGFAVVLLTPDDVGGIGLGSIQAARARQNVVFELGYFAGKLGRGRTCLLRKGDVEIPSDLYGVIYTEMDPADGWKGKLARELDAAGLRFDPAKVWG
jgi:predicted nucleotide-binding protein